MYSDSEQEELLLNCYISSVLRNAGKELRRNKDKKVHFGENSERECSLIILEAFEDTLPIDENAGTFKQIDMRIDVEGLNNDFKAIYEEDSDGEENYKKHLWLNSNSPEQVEQSTDYEDLDTVVNSYDDFLKGARKRLFVNLLTENTKDSPIASPNRKKVKCAQDELEESQRCSTPEHENDLCFSEDIFSYLKYHVFSYALQKHSKYLESLGCKQKNSSAIASIRILSHEIINTTATEKTCSQESHKQKMEIDQTQKESIAVCLAQTILEENNQNNIEFEKNILENKRLERNNIDRKNKSTRKNIEIKNNAGESDEDIFIQNSSPSLFPSKQSYNVFLKRDCLSEREEVSTPASSYTPMSEEERALLPYVELNTYLLPEMREDHVRDSILPSFLGCLDPERLPEQLKKDSKLRDYKVEKLTNISVEEEDFCSPIFTQYSETPVSDSEVSMIYRDNYTNDRDSSMENQDNDMEKDISPTYKNKFKDWEDQCEYYAHAKNSVDDMISELLVSQFLHSPARKRIKSDVTERVSKQKQRQTEKGSYEYKYFMQISGDKHAHVKESEDNDRIVPGSLKSSHFEDKNASIYESCRPKLMGKENESEKLHMNVKQYNEMDDDSKPDQSVPSLPCMKDNEHSHNSSFNWKRSDDAVVPFSHELFFDSPSKIRTPQKIRLGLSKKERVKINLHPYKKI